MQRSVAYDFLTQQENRFTNDRCAAAEAGAEMKSRIAERIALVLEKKPKLRPLYDERLELQNLIDERRATGSKVPLAWIQNLFHRTYYVFKRWAE